MENNFGLLSVRQLNFYVKSLLEGDKRLVSLAVCGEISNFKRHFSSGHCYFTLKDEFAAVKCVMFKASAMRVPFALTDGLKVVCRGRVSMYEKDGTYQFYCESIEPDGVGAKALALEQLKQKLQSEGLFDIANKRKLTPFPKKIAVVTSGSGAALHDIINVISRRYPVCEIIVASVSVQGERAVSEILNMLDRIYERDDVDTVIIGRGGGSSEDLDAFNNELVARKVYESPFPVISAVGHETDVTVCDLVADMRAPTPSAAAELAVPDLISVKSHCEVLFKRISSLLDNSLSLASARLNVICGLSVFKNPELIFDSRLLLVDRLQEKMNIAFSNILKNNDKRFSNVVLKIDALSPLKCLARGYSVVYSKNKTVTDANQVNIGDELKIRTNNGTVICDVTGKE